MFFFPWILGTQIGCIACSKIADEPIGIDTADSGYFDTGSPDTDDTDDTNDTNDTTDTNDTDTSDTQDTNDTNPNDTGGPVQQDGPVFYFEDEIQVGGTNMWSNLWAKNNGFFFSTMQNEQVAFRTFNMDLEPTSPLVLVTDTSDFPPGVQMSDHEMLRLNNALYFVASGFGDEDLVIIKTDLQGNRLENYTIQNQGDNGPACNDPHLLLVDEEICVRWGTSGTNKSIQCFDEQLSPITQSFEILMADPIPQLGYSVQVDNEIWSFTGDAPQRDLIISKYDVNWRPLNPFTEIILESENSDWNWFPGGVAYHEQYEMWFVVFTHMEDEEEANFDSVVKLAAFDDDFDLLDIKILSGPGYTRPNLALINNEVVVSYDNGNLVWLEKWSIEPVQ